MDQYYVSFPAAVIFSEHSVTIKKNFTGPHDEAWDGPIMISKSGQFIYTDIKCETRILIFLKFLS